MSSDNPFEAFDTPDAPEVVDHLMYVKQTQPWVIFLAVMTFLFAAFCLLAAVAMVGMGAFTMGGAGSEGLVMMAVLGGVYGLIALFYGGLGYLMIRMAMAMGQVASGGGLEAVGAMLKHTRNFWRTTGIITLVFMVLYCGGIGVFTMVGSALSSTFADIENLE
ncbi:MAG: hypothetical protein KTR31_10420 [Myxococcales bacterium]|nr:hypothetical protein [Myxococcales bacterium]